MIGYELTRAKDKALAINVKDGRVKVSAPMGMPICEIEGIMELHAEELAREVARQIMSPKASDAAGAGIPERSRIPAYELKRSKRRSIGIEVTDDLRVIVRSPIGLERARIDEFVLKYSDWIENHRKMAAARASEHPEPNEDQREQYIQKAQRMLPERVAHYGRIMNLEPAAITVTNARGRFGSCSGARRLCFSWRLMMYPQPAIDYVVVHELAHLRHMNHSDEFYAEVERVMPDYKQRAKLLR